MIPEAWLRWKGARVEGRKSKGKTNGRENYVLRKDRQKVGQIKVKLLETRKAESDEERTRQNEEGE